MFGLREEVVVAVVMAEGSEDAVGESVLDDESGSVGGGGTVDFVNTFSDERVVDYLPYELRDIIMVGNFAS